MAEQFGRKVSLIIGPDAGDALDLSGLRIVFRVQRGDTQTPNSLRARVYNVSDNTAQRAESKEFTRIVLQAGYEGNYGIIFDGSIIQVRRGREPDRHLHGYHGGRRRHGIQLRRGKYDAGGRRDAG